MTTPDNPFTVLPPRFPQQEADAFMALFHGMGRNYVDAVVLCLLLEMHAGTSEDQWITSSYRELAAKSQGAFAYRVVGKSFHRLAQQGCIEVSEGRVRANAERAHELIRLSHSQEAMNSVWLLWVMAQIPNWVECATLVLLVQEGALHRPVRRTLAEIAQGIPGAASIYGVFNSAKCLRLNYLVERGRPGFRSPYALKVNGSALQSLLSQEADLWIAAGSPEEPWMPGRRIAVSSGSIPGETAFVESAVRTL